MQTTTATIVYAGPKWVWVRLASHPTRLLTLPRVALAGEKGDSFEVRASTPESTGHGWSALVIPTGQQTSR